MKKCEIKTKLIDMLDNLFLSPYLQPNILEHVDFIDDLGMDSLSFISIVIETESTFDITIPEEMLLMENFRTVDRIIEIVENEKNFNKSIANE